jgi:hypothetical protein
MALLFFPQKGLLVEEDRSVLIIRVEFFLEFIAQFAQLVIKLSDVLGIDIRKVRSPTVCRNLRSIFLDLSKFLLEKLRSF